MGLHNRARRKNERSFYQFASIFTDVPQLNKQVNKRKWLTTWIEPLLHKNEQLSSIYIHSHFYAGMIISVYIFA